MDYFKYVLEQTSGSLFVHLDIYSKLVGVHPATPYNQLHHGKFPLPTVRAGKGIAVRAVDLAAYLEHGVVAPSQQKRGPGRPRKYSDAARTRATKEKKVKAVPACASESAKVAI